jgi:Glycine zipper 2TM domain
MRGIHPTLAGAALVLAASAAFADPPAYRFDGGNAPAPSAQAQPQYDSQGNYVEPQTIANSQQMWLGEDGEYHCKRKNGTTGLVIGAVAGGVLGNVIAGRGDKTLGTIVGAVGGAVIGRMISRGQVKCQ